MATASSTEFDLSPVKFSRLTRRGIILGLSLPQVITISVAALVFVASCTPVARPPCTRHPYGVPPSAWPWCRSVVEK